MVQYCCMLIFSVMVFVSMAIAHHDQTPFPTKRLTVEQGLSQNSVQDFLQDRRGFMWFGTSDGLNRYDGYSFTVFRHNDRDSASLIHNWVAALLEDREGLLWIGTAQGVSVWNPKINRFTNYRHNPADPYSIGADGVFSLMEDRAGNVWVTMLASGLARFDRATRHFTRYTHNPHNPKSLRSNQVYAICEDKQNGLWVATGNGLQYFDPKTETFTHHALIAETPTREIVRRLYLDKSGMLWAGTANNGLYLLDPATKRVLRNWRKGNNAGDLASNYINALYESRDGRFWVGTQEGGLQTLDRTTGVFQTQLPNDEDDTDTGTHTILGVKEDRSGMLWISTNSGGMRTHSTFDKRFTSLRYSPNKLRSLSHNDVLCIHEDRAGMVWIGTYGGGLNRYEPKTRTFSVVRHNPNDPSSLGYDYMRTVLEDSRGVLWIGTFGGGLSRAERSADGVIKKFTTFTRIPNDSTSLSSNHIWRLVEDSAGNIWAGTEDGSLNKLDRNNLHQGIVRFRHWRIRRDRAIPIQALLYDRAGSLWVGTWGEGLRRFDEAKGVFQPSIQHERGDTNNVAARNVISVCEDKRGALWYGTYGGGLYRWDRARQASSPQALLNLTSENGLPNDVVYGIVEDAEGRLWVSTNKGIASLTCTDSTKPAESASYRIRAFEASDGLQSNEFNRGAYTKLQNGMIAFGGVGGITMFDPADVRENKHPPDVVLTGFRKFNQLVPLDSAISERSVLELTHRDTFFSFEFAGLDYVNPAKNIYAYKLENFDENWIQSGTQRSVNYTNLDAGEYIFRVRAANSDGVWSPEGASLRVIIHPPVWKTWWFRLGAGCCALVLVWGVYRNRVRGIQRRNRELKLLVDERTVEIRRQMALVDTQAREIQDVNAALALKNMALEDSNSKLAEADRFKTRILSIAAHDLKNPLGAIIGFAELMLSELEPQNRFLPMVEAMAKSATRMLDLIKNILDVSSVEMGRMELSWEIIDFGYICVNAAEAHVVAAEQKSQTLVFDVEPSCMVRADIARLGQVVENLVSNAVKYSPFGAEIHVSVHRNYDFTRLAVRDQGPGLTEEDQQKLFGFFQRLSARPTGNESSNGVGLAIVKQIVELHDGRVWAESEIGNGSTFIVEMPLVGKDRE